MLSSAAEFVLDALSEVVSWSSFFGLFALCIGAGLGFFIGRQDALSQMQTCQKASPSCTVYAEKSALGDWLVVPVAKTPLASAAK